MYKVTRATTKINLLSFVRLIRVVNSLRVLSFNTDAYTQV